MEIQGFNKYDFETFQIDGLEDRMEAIQTRIQPKFRVFGNHLVQYLAETLDQEMYLHIAKHARRTKNAPNDTWAAFSHNKRGYKKHPHFQLGLWDDRVFVWLAFIYELPNKVEIAEVFLNHEEELLNIIPNEFVLSMDHMKKDIQPIHATTLNASLNRFKNVKKAELLIGKQFPAEHPLLSNGEEFLSEVKDIFEKLLPVYTLSFKYM